MSQNPDTKDYVIVLSNVYCENCGKKCNTNSLYNWCKLCFINDLKRNFINWTSENEKIDRFIQEMQSKFNDYNDKIFEWIPYNQFNEIKEISKNDSTTIYLATWKGGPLIR